MPLRKDAKVELLRRAQLFEGLSKRELQEVAALADEIDLPEGKELIREGERGREFFVIVEGSVEVRKRGRKVAIRGGAELFGEISLLSNAPTNASVRTTSPVRALVITDRAFRALLERSPQLQLKILQSLAERLAPDAF